MCPLNECNGQPVLPVGLKDTLRYHEVMIYCPRCGLIFHPAQKQLNFRDDNLDGAYFGTTFAHLLLMQVSYLLYDDVLFPPVLLLADTSLSLLLLPLFPSSPPSFPSFPSLSPSLQYPALKPKKKFRLQPYVPRVFGYKIRQQGLEDGGGSDTNGSNSEAKESKNPPSPASGVTEAGPAISVIEENAALKQEIVSLKKRLADGK